MEVDSLSRLGVSAAFSPVPATQNANATNRQIVKAVQEVNQSELLGQDRYLQYRRDQRTGQMVVQTVSRQNGDVLDQIPLEVLLRLQAELTEETKARAVSATANSD